MKRLIEEVTNQSLCDAAGELNGNESSSNKRVKIGEKQEVSFSVLDKLSDECFELVLKFLCMASVLVDQKDEKEDEENDGQYDGLRLRDTELERKLAMRNVVINWKELKSLSLVSKSLLLKCLPFMIEHETKRVGVHVFDNTSEFFRPVEAQLELLKQRASSNDIKIKKHQQWDKWFNSEIFDLRTPLPSVEAQKELKDKILNRASYSFQKTNRQMIGKYERSAYCHLLEDLHLYHEYESSYDECSFTITIFGDLDQVQKSIRKDVMQYLVLPDTTFYSEMSDCECEDEENEDSTEFKSIELMTSNYVHANVRLSTLNFVREKLEISSQVTDRELIDALVNILPYDFTSKPSETHYENVEFDEEEEEIDFTLRNEKKEKERTYDEQIGHGLCSTPSECRSIFEVGYGIVLHIMGFLRLKYVTTLSETNKAFFSIYWKSGWSFPIRMRKVIDIFSPIFERTSISKLLSVVRDARYNAFSTHPSFVKYSSVRFANIDYLSSVHTVLKVGNRTFTFNSFDDEGSNSNFEMDDITCGEVTKYYDSDHDFICNTGNLRVKPEVIANLKDIFNESSYGDDGDLVEKFLRLLPWDSSVNWMFVSEIKIGDSETRKKGHKKIPHND